MRIPASLRASQLPVPAPEPGKTRVVRVVVYDGPADWIDRVLAQSLNGVHTMGQSRQVTAITIDAEHLPYEIERQLAFAQRDESWKPWNNEADTKPSSDASGS